MATRRYPGYSPRGRKDWVYAHGDLETSCAQLGNLRAGSRRDLPALSVVRTSQWGILPRLGFKMFPPAPPLLKPLTPQNEQVQELEESTVKHTFGSVAAPYSTASMESLANRKTSHPALEVSGEAPRLQHMALDFLPPSSPNMDLTWINRGGGKQEAVKQFSGK